MRQTSGFGKLLLPAALLLAVCLALPARADDKGKGKDTPPAKTEDVDVEKLVQEVTRRVLEELRGQKKGATRKGDDRKNQPTKEEFRKKGDAKPHIVRVDLNKLPPELARQVEKYAEQGKQDEGKKGPVRDEQVEDKKGSIKGKQAEDKKGQQQDKKGQQQDKKNDKGD